MYGYRPRFITDAQLTEAVNLYHLARTALSGSKDTGRHARLVWASDELKKQYPNASWSATGAYKDLCSALES